MSFTGNAPKQQSHWREVWRVLHKNLGRRSAQEKRTGEQRAAEGGEDLMRFLSGKGFTRAQSSSFSSTHQRIPCQRSPSV